MFWRKISGKLIIWFGVGIGKRREKKLNVKVLSEGRPILVVET